MLVIVKLIDPDAVYVNLWPVPTVYLALLIEIKQNFSDLSPGVSDSSDFFFKHLKKKGIQKAYSSEGRIPNVLGI